MQTLHRPKVDGKPRLAIPFVRILSRIRETNLRIPVATLQKELPYPLLSDPKRLLIGALGAADGTKTKRSHFVFAKGGKLLDKKMPVKPVDR